MNTTELIANRPASERPKKGEHMETPSSVDERVLTSFVKDGVEYVPVLLTTTSISYFAKKDVDTLATAHDTLPSYAWNGSLIGTEAAQQLCKDAVNSGTIMRQSARLQPIITNYFAWNRAPQGVECKRTRLMDYVVTRSQDKAEPLPIKHVTALESAHDQIEAERKAAAIALLRAQAKALGISLSDLA